MPNEQTSVRPTPLQLRCGNASGAQLFLRVVAVGDNHQADQLSGNELRRTGDFDEMF
jgi:hypothetical protein